MDITDNIGWIATLVGALGGWELIKWLLNRDTNKRIGAAQAFEAEYKALIEDYHRVQKEVDDAKKEIAKLNEKLDELYKQVHRLFISRCIGSKVNVSTLSRRTTSCALP